MTSEYHKIEKLYRTVAFLTTGAWLCVLGAFVSYETDKIPAGVFLLTAFCFAYVAGIVNDNARKRLKRYNENVDNPNRL